MKSISTILLTGLFLALSTGCGKDNYDEPNAFLTGKIVYNGETLQVRGTGEAVQLQLYQDGFAKKDPIPVFVGQDGTFSAQLFNGEYKLVTRDNNGPWVNTRDTTLVNVKGGTNIELNVTPYFTISDAQLSISSTTMNASFTINQVVSSAKINRVVLVLSKTRFTDDVSNVFRKDISDVAPGSVDLSADFSGNRDVTDANALFGRVAVYADGADQAIYSPVIKLK